MMAEAGPDLDACGRSPVIAPNVSQQAIAAITNESDKCIAIEIM